MSDSKVLQNSAHPKWFWISAATLTLLTHYAWEIAQARFFSNHKYQAITEYALHCFVASVGDVIIAGSGYALTARLFKNRYWLLGPRVAKPMILWIVIGIVLTVVFEILALKTGHWAYAGDMPTVLGIGVAPLLQWSLIPPLTLVLLRSYWKRSAIRPAP